MDESGQNEVKMGKVPSRNRKKLSFVSNIFRYTVNWSTWYELYSKVFLSISSEFWI